MKTCFKCKETKDISLFYKHKMMADGHLNKCKECAKIDSNNHRHENIEKSRKYDRNRPNKKERAIRQSEYRASEKGKIVANKARKNYVNSNPLRYKANIAVGNAIRDGKLIRPSECSECFKKCKPHGHHDNYYEKLNVRWLCASCHIKFHKEARELFRSDGITSQYMI